MHIPDNDIKQQAKLNILTPAFSILFLLGLAWWQVNYPDSMDWWSDEDRPFEYGTSLVYGLASLLFVLMVRRGRFPVQSMQRMGQLILAIGAIGCFFIMGEEVSWGQRIIGFDTPEAWAEKNYQQETTLHNLDWVYENLTSSQTGIFKANFFNLVMLGVGFVLPLAALVPWIRRLSARLAVPIIPLRFCVLFVGGWIYGKYLQPYAIDSNGPPEVREFIYSLGILMFAITGLMRPWELYGSRPDEMSGEE
jgi:hypothetical protein